LIRERLEFLMGGKIVTVGGNTREKKEVLIGKSIIDVRSHGKRLIFDLGDVYLVIHFLMYGKYSLNKPIEAKQVRLLLVFENCELFFYNTSVKILSKNSLSFDEDNDIMSEFFNVEKAKSLVGRSAEPIVDLLLDQNVFAGVGNIIKNEALFRAKVHPLSVGKNLPSAAVEKLIEETLKFSRTFYEYRKLGHPLKTALKVYGRRNCIDCGQEIVLKYLGKTKRKTYFCPNCQILYS